ncbi:MAG: dienelactone hydrolase family protein [Gaiellaceae bacterium]
MTAIATAVRIDVGVAAMDGDLIVPDAARGMVLFAHGSRSSRDILPNRYVAEALPQVQLATLRLALLAPEEEAIGARRAHMRNDIALLADRLVVAGDWLAAHELTASLALGLFGTSSGAAAALLMAARRPRAVVRAVVSRSGRPDLAGDALSLVKAPTLLIVGALNPLVRELNELAMRRLGTEKKKLEIIAGATHLIDKPDALERVAELACDWFLQHLTGR